MLKTLMVDDLLDLLNQPPARHSDTRGFRGSDRAHRCDGCGEVKPEVDIWATNHQTGEVLKLCLPCAEQ